MKTVFLLLFLIPSTRLLAQPADGYKGPAKLYINSFWQYAKTTRDMLGRGAFNMAPRITNMEGTIAAIKAKDPSYDTTTLHTEVLAIQQLMTVKESSNKDQFNQVQIQKEKKELEVKTAGKAADDIKERAKKLLDMVFETSIGENTVENIREKTDLLGKNVQELLAIDLAACGNTPGIYENRLKNRTNGAEAKYSGLAKRIKESVDSRQALVDYYLLVYYKTYWDAAQKIFPANPAFSGLFSKTEKIAGEAGNADDISKQAEKNYRQKVIDTRLPAPKVKDAALEKLFMDAFDKMYGESFKGKAFKAIILTDDWLIQRQEVTGIVTGRLRNGAVVYKNLDGQCRLVGDFTIQQEYVGNSFTGTKSVYAVGKGQEMLCENAQ